MPNYRKILYLYEMGVSQRQISVSEHMSRNTVSRIIKQAQLHSVCSDQLETLSDSEAEQLLKVHINEPGKPGELYEMPDYDYYSKELKKPGVTITLLWEEYVSQCRKSGKVPYQKILEMYYELCPSMSKVRPVNKYTDEIKRNVKARYAEYTIEDFTTVFKKAEASDFLNNRADVTFQASFDWLMRPKNFSKALNGNFDNIAKKPKETIKGTNIAMSIVADGTREDSPEPEVRFE